MLQLPHLFHSMTKAAAIHLLTEFAPVLAFFIAGQLLSFSAAALTLVVTTLIALSISWWYERRIPFLPFLSGVFIVISGFITYVWDTPDALIFADTVYYLLMGGIVGIGLYYRWYFLKWLFESTFAMYDIGWRILSWRWLIAFFLAGIANEVVRVAMTPEFWIDYRVVKVLLIAGFGCYQFTLSRRYRIPGISNHWGLRLTKYHTSLPTPPGQVR